MKWYSVWINGSGLCCIKARSKFGALLNAVRLTGISLKGTERSVDVYRVR